MQCRVRLVYLFIPGIVVILERQKTTKKKLFSTGNAEKGTGRNSHAEGDTERQTDNNSLKEPGRRVSLHLSVHEGGVQAGRHR